MLICGHTLVVRGRVQARQPLGGERAHGRVLAHVHRRAHRALAVQEERERERQVPRAGTHTYLLAQLIQNMHSYRLYKMFYGYLLCIVLFKSCRGLLQRNSHKLVLL